MYDHFFSCESCDNLKFMIEKEATKSVAAIHGDETIDKMTKELSEAKREIVKIKKEKDDIVKELSFVKSEQLKKDLESRKVDIVKANLNKELKLATGYWAS